MIDPQEPEYEYRQVAEAIVRSIESGFLRGKLPGEISMARDYGVAVGTLRRALRDVRESGLIRTLPARGSFVITAR